MRVLAIDSSGSVATCAVVNDEKVECEIYLNDKLQHSVVLFPMIENSLKMLDITIDGIDAVAVSGGPGSFTGLRIGVAAAKGIAQGGEKKFIGISSLDAMAFQQVGFDGIICPIMDALRDNIYTAAYTFKNGEFLKLSDYEALHIDELLETLAGKGEKIMFCGDGLRAHRDRIKERLGNKVYFAPKLSTMPRASALGEIALARLNQGMEDDIYSYSPIYIRKSQAERELEKKEGKGCE